jgi:hypothetical protein
MNGLRVTGNDGFVADNLLLSTFNVTVFTPMDMTYFAPPLTIDVDTKILMPVGLDIHQLSGMAGHFRQLVIATEGGAEWVFDNMICTLYNMSVTAGEMMIADIKWRGYSQPYHIDPANTTTPRPRAFAPAPALLPVAWQREGF